MKTHIEKIALVIVSTVLSLALAEYLVAPLVLSIRGQLSRSYVLLSVAAKPNVLVDDTIINSQGFTGDVLSEQKPSHTNRILTLGGSVMFNRRMTERLGLSLKRITSIPLEIQGGALRAHTSQDSLIKYKFHFHSFNFNYVLIYEGINDLWMNHISPDRFEADYSHARPWYRRNIVLNNSVVARYLYNDFLWSRPTCDFENLFSGRNSYLRGGPLPSCHNGASFRAYDSFSRNVKYLIDLIRADHGVPILITFAFNVPPNYSRQAFQADELGYVNPTHYDKWPVELWGAPSYVKEGVREQNRIIRRIASEERVLFIDMDKQVSGTIRMFGDPVHPNEEGVEEFVKIITNFFASNGLLATNE
jgi:lysophospholipase L1-like esterase